MIRKPVEITIVRRWIAFSFNFRGRGRAERELINSKVKVIWWVVVGEDYLVSPTPLLSLGFKSFRSRLSRPCQ